ncbi:hypothetical protein [Chondrinema litorale]|uniref:hypothetical protein n=1 Tax=Chondrinema litorale TaxID=2994555 RepID=UPI00254291BB|nr:hypothetical protein [Chondrinema litorale]UZR94924.1 hypothetical protein OQ292_03740 [Chondrinema litorale]
MKRILLLIAMVGALFSCVSENEQKGLDKIANHYNVKTSYTKGFKTNAGEKNTIFTIKVGDSEMIDTMQHALVSSNIALMLYESFTPEERSEYSYLEVKFDKDSAKEDGSFYEPALLADGLDQAVIFSNFSDNLLTKNYEAIVNNLKPEYKSPQLANNLSNFMANLSNQHGEVIDYKRVGFGISNGGSLFHYSGHLKFRDGFVKSYFLTASKQPSEDYIMGYNLE